MAFSADQVNIAVHQVSKIELQDMYIQLNAMMGVNSTNFGTYITTTLIPALSEKLNISPVLVQTLLNQFTTIERAWASKDDIHALGYQPIMNGQTQYQQQVPIRYQTYLNNVLESIMSQQQNQMLNN
ncbi:MAG: hypothetical protein FWC03_09555 [Treponema sp.]|nr:hypothetical protein [Treponema sp.]